MRVHDERVGALAAVEQVTELRENRSRSGIGRVDVQPHAVLSAYFGDRGNGIRRSRRGRAHRRCDAHRPQSGRDVARQQRVERLGQHRKRLVDRNAHDVFATDAERERGLLDVRMRVLGEVHSKRRQIRTSRHTTFPDSQIERLARGGQRGEAGD